MTNANISCLLDFLVAQQSKFTHRLSYLETFNAFWFAYLGKLESMSFNELSFKSVHTVLVTFQWLVILPYPCRTAHPLIYCTPSIPFFQLVTVQFYHIRFIIWIFDVIL